VADSKKIIGNQNLEAKEMYRDVETGKGNRMLYQKVNKARAEPLRLARENNELLKQLVSLMSPKKEPVKATKENHGAVR